MVNKIKDGNNFKVLPPDEIQRRLAQANRFEHLYEPINSKPVQASFGLRFWVASGLLFTFVIVIAAFL